MDEEDLLVSFCEIFNSNAIIFLGAQFQGRNICWHYPEDKFRIFK